MKASNDFSLSPSGQRAVVRNGFSQYDVFGEVVGGLPLLACAIDGPLDAPENIPAGSMRSYRGAYGAPKSISAQTTIFCRSY